jgi:hypothetical protein
VKFLERVNAALHHQKPDRIPFAPSENIIPRGDFEREMRNRGMGLYAKRATYWSETPNVGIESKRQADTSLTVYNTPVGSISAGRMGNKTRRMIEDIGDYEPVIFMIRDSVFHADYSVYSNSVRDLGPDGIVRGSGVEPPFEDAVEYLGVAGLEKEKSEHPKQFAELLEALEQRTERLISLIEESPAEFISVGGIGDSLTPDQFREYYLPFYRKYLPRLHEKGKICAIDIGTSGLKAFKDLIPQTGIDVIEGFSPSPVGDLPLEEALETWSSDITIWLNFPETVIFDSADTTKEYTINLLRSDLTVRSLIIGLMSVRRMTDEAMEGKFKTGLRTIMDLVDSI